MRAAAARFVSAVVWFLLGALAAVVALLVLFPEPVP